MIGAMGCPMGLRGLLFAFVRILVADILRR